MLSSYFGNRDEAHGPLNVDFVYMLVFLPVAAFGARRILGVDDYVEQYEVDGHPSWYPLLEYVLG